MSAPASKVDVLAVLTPGEGKIIEPSAWRYKDAVITRTPSAPAAPTAPESATYEQTWRTRYQTLLFCLEDRPRIALVDAAALEVARAAVAELVEAGKRTDAAIMAWRMSGKPDLGELNAAHGDLNAALARFGGA